MFGSTLSVPEDFLQFSSTCDDPEDSSELEVKS